MKKNLFLKGALLVGMTMATGCSNEDVLEQNQGNLTVVKATIDNGSNTRTSVNELYQVVWSEGDAFTVFDGDTKKGDMALQGEGGATTGDFGGTLNQALAEGDVALFPAVGDVSTMTYTFEDTYTDTETDAPLYGTYNGTSFTFSPLSAVIRVNASGLNDETEYVLTITSTGDQALTGDAIVTNGALSAPTGEGKTITVTLTPAQGVTSLTFDAPIPAQTYTKLTVELKGGNDSEAILEKELDSFIAVAGKLYEATTKVTSHETLAAALEKGGNVDIAAPITLTENLEVKENTILDLNNQTITTDNKTITVAAGKILTIQNAATLSRSADGPSITGSGDIITASNNSTIIIGEGVNLTSTDNCCIYVPQNVSGVTITTAGNLTSNSSRYATIQAGGTANDVTVNVIGGTVSGTCEAIYFPCTTNLNISGGTIEGTTAVYHKSGNLNISGGTLKATGEKVDYVHDASGCDATGDALVIEACNYPGGVPFVSITGGTFISAKAKAVGYYQESEDYKLENENFITGGTFSDASAFNYLANDAEVKLGAECELSSLVAINAANATIDLNEKTVTANCQKAFEVYADATIKNGTIVSQQRCVDTRKAVNLVLTDVALNAPQYYSAYGNQQPLTIGGSEDGTKVTMNNVTIDAGTTGYGIISFVKTELKATDCKVDGYVVLYSKAGSGGSEYVFTNCDLTNDITGNDVAGNSTTLINIEGIKDVKVNVNGGTVTSNGNNTAAVGFRAGATGNSVTIKDATITGNILYNYSEGNTLTVPAASKDMVTREGYDYTDNSDGTITIKKEE